MNLASPSESPVAAPSQVDYSGIHFDDAEPNEREQDLARSVAPLLGRTTEILERLSTYRGCAEPIKIAVRTPSVENDVAAWQAVVPAVRMLQDFFAFYGEFNEKTARGVLIAE